MRFRGLLTGPLLAALTCGVALAAPPVGQGSKARDAFDPQGLPPREKPIPGKPHPAEIPQVPQPTAPGQASKPGHVGPPVESAPPESFQPPGLEKRPIRDPKTHHKKFHLKDDAHVTVTILGPEGFPIRQYRLRPGQAGARRGDNDVTLWDGRDQHGHPAREGPHLIIQEIEYPHGQRETKVHPVN